MDVFLHNFRRIGWVCFAVYTLHIWSDFTFAFICTFVVRSFFFCLRFRINTKLVNTLIDGWSQWLKRRDWDALNGDLVNFVFVRTSSRKYTMFRNVYVKWERERQICCVFLEVAYVYLRIFLENIFRGSWSFVEN